MPVTTSRDLDDLIALRLANVFVVPESRREGIAAEIMGAVIEWARAEGMVRIVLAPA